MKREEPFQLIMFTHDKDMAIAANREGVDLIGPDLEVIGKDERQSDRIYRISRHTLDDLEVVYEHVQPARRFVRCNPMNTGSASEIEAVLSRGAVAIMLPYFKTFEEVETFVNMIAGRAEAILLVETRGAAESLEKILSCLKIARIHVGLNDLAIDTASKNRFSLLCSDWMGHICEIPKRFEIPFGLGGIARVVDGGVPMPPDLIYAQYARLGARCAVISRSFTNDISPDQLGFELAKSKVRIDYWFSQSKEVLQKGKRLTRPHAMLRRLQAS